MLDSAKDTGQGFILPRVSFNYMIALLLGIILPLFVIIAKEILDNRIHTAEDIERVSPIPILGIIGRNSAINNLDFWHDFIKQFPKFQRLNVKKKKF